MAGGTADTAGVCRRDAMIEADDWRGPALRRGPLRHGAADVDESVGDDAEPDPARHSGVALVAAAVESVPALDDADAALASGAPFLAVAEPALPLLALALGTFGRAVGNAHALDALGFRRPLVLRGVEGGVGRHQARRAAQPCRQRFDVAVQQVAVGGPPTVDFVGGDDLVFGLLEFHHLAELGRLAGLAFADDFRRWLEHAEHLAFAAGVAAEDAGAGLLHHLADQRHHPLDLRAQTLQRQLLADIGRAFHPAGDLRGEALRLPHHAARRTE